MVSCEFCETVNNTIFTDHLGTPASKFIEHICISQNLVLISQGGFSNQHVKSKLRERENLFFLHFFLICYKFVFKRG